MSVAVIGFDPSMASFGVSDGTTSIRITTEPGLRPLERALHIRGHIMDFIAEVKRERPDAPLVFVIEGAAFGMASASAQVDAGYIMAHFDLIAAACGAIVYVVPPATLKKFVTGKGNTPKAEMPLRVFKKWGLEFAGDPGCDKLMAYCLYRYGVALCAGEIEHAAPAPRGRGKDATKRLAKRAKTMAGAR